MSNKKDPVDAYDLSDDSIERVRSLTPEELDYAYRLKEFSDRTEDAQRHLIDELADRGRPDLYKNGIGQKLLEEMAARYLESEDCNVAENDRWDMIASEMADRMENTRQDYRVQLNVRLIKHFKVSASSVFEAENIVLEDFKNGRIKLSELESVGPTVLAHLIDDPADDVDDEDEE